MTEKRNIGVQVKHLPYKIERLFCVSFTVWNAATLYCSAAADAISGKFICAL